MYSQDRSLSYVVGSELPGPYKTCIQRLEDGVSTYPKEVAVVCAHQPPDLYGIKSKLCENEDYKTSPYLRWTYGEYHAMVERLARALAAAGVGNGTPLFTFLPNGVEFLIILFASSRLGSSLIPINIRNLTNVQEVRHMIDTALLECVVPGKAVVFTDTPETAAKLDNFEQLANAQRILTSVEGWERWHTFSSLLETAQPGQTLPDHRTFSETIPTASYFSQAVQRACLKGVPGTIRPWPASSIIE